MLVYGILEVLMLKQKKYIIFIVLTLALIGIISLVVALNNSGGESAPTPPAENIDNESQTTSEEPTAQSNFSDGDEREPGNSLSEDDGVGSVENDNAPVEPTDNPIASDDDKTVVYSPTNNQMILSGSAISGNTQNDNVYFRLIDNKVGLIGEGKLTLKDNGDFSGKFNIDSHGDKGRLDIFSRSNEGIEYSAVYIDVRFK